MAAIFTRDVITMLAAVASALMLFFMWGAGAQRRDKELRRKRRDAYLFRTGLFRSIARALHGPPRLTDQRHRTDRAP